MDAVRHTFWAIPTSLQILLYVLSSVSILLFLYGFWRRVSIWKRGRKVTLSFTQAKANVRERFLAILSQKRIREEKKSGRMHLLLSAGMVVLFIGTVLVFLDYDLHLHFLRGWFYLLFEMTLDLFGILFLIGVGLALFHRLPSQSIKRLVNKPIDYTMLVLLFLIGVGGFLLEGLRIAITSPAYGGWSFVGYGLGMGLRAMGITSITLYEVTWASHMLLALAWIAIIPYTKLLHIFIAPLNMLLSPPVTQTEIQPAFNLAQQPLDYWIEQQAGLGGKRAEDFTFLQLLSLDACTECGRCDDVCPATLSGKPLAPRNIITRLRDQVGKPILTGFSQEELLSCTTCGACMERCPVSIRHVPLIVSLRQGLVADNHLEPEMEQTLAHIQHSFNPWGHPERTRTDWTRGLQVNVVEKVAKNATKEGTH